MYNHHIPFFSAGTAPVVSHFERESRTPDIPLKRHPILLSLLSLPHYALFFLYFPPVKSLFESSLEDAKDVSHALLCITPAHFHSHFSSFLLFSFYHPPKNSQWDKRKLNLLSHSYTRAFTCHLFGVILLLNVDFFSILFIHRFYDLHRSVKLLSF